MNYLEFKAAMSAKKSEGARTAKLMSEPVAPSAARQRIDAKLAELKTALDAKYKK